MNRHLVPAALALLGGAAGCEVGDQAAAGPAESSPACLEAVDHSDLEWIEDNVFAPGCAAFSACHQGSAPSAGGLDLEKGRAADNLIDAPSKVAAGMQLVTPGDPENSYLLVILGQYGADDPRIDASIGTMPPNGELLCEEKRDAIERWIAEL